MTSSLPPGTPFSDLAAALSFPGVLSLPTFQSSTSSAAQLVDQLLMMGTAPTGHWNLTEGALAQQPLPPLLDTLRELLVARREKQMAVAHLLRWERGALKSSALLKNAGLSSPLVLKGGAAKYALYPTPYLRTSADLDLLLPAAEVDPAIGVMEQAGFTLVATDHRRPYTARFGHQVMLRRERTIVELHRSVDNLERPSMSFDALIDESRSITGLDPWLRGPSPEVALLIAAAHALKHGLLLPLRDLVDVQLALEDAHLDVDLLLTRAKEADLDQVLAFLASQAGSLSGRWTSRHSAAVEALPEATNLSFKEWRYGGNAMSGGFPRILLAHLQLTPGTASTRRLLARFVNRRVRDLLTR